MKHRWIYLLPVMTLLLSCGKDSGAEQATKLPTIPVKTAKAEVGRI